MVRDRRLRELEGGGEVAHADLVRSREPVDDRDPGGVGERLEPGGELVARLLGERRRIGAAAEGLEDGESFH